MVSLHFVIGRTLKFFLVICLQIQILYLKRVPRWAVRRPYRIVNLLGQTVVRGQAVAGANNVPVPMLLPGVYYLLLDTAAGTERSKFYKE